MSYATLHKKVKFFIKIFSVNVTKGGDLVTFTEEIPKGKLNFFVR